MKFSRRLTVEKDRCPADLFEAIVRLRPECYRGGGSFHIETDPEDTLGAKLVDEIISMCEVRGLQRSAPGMVGAYIYHVHHEYELDDLTSAPLLQLMTQKRMFKGIDSGDRDASGRVWLPASEAKPTIKTLSIFLRPWVVVSNNTRHMLENGELVGLKFDPVTIRGYSVYASADPFWELRSTITLPRMVNAVSNPGVTCESYWARGQYGEFHYRQGDLRPLGQFDIAFTAEPFGGAVPNPELVVSQRFYQHCRKHKIPLEVKPVRIDPD